MLISIAAISVGAALGALLRWLLGLWLNTMFASIPAGTLAANLIGGYLIGVAMGLFARYPQLPVEWRLFVVTGFLGGLTTFSTFSAEVVSLLQNGRFQAALAAVSLHVAGSLAMTFLGIASHAVLARNWGFFDSGG